MENTQTDWSAADALQTLQQSFQLKKPIFTIFREDELLEPVKIAPDTIKKIEKKRHGNSLKKICTKILRFYHKKEDTEIFLNEFSLNLNIERRRIYDIINILEALDIVVKKSKNVYIWKNINLFTTKLKILSAAGQNLAEQLKLFFFETRPITSKKKMLTYLALKVLKLFYTNKPVLSFSEIMKICEDHYNQVQSSMNLPPNDEFESKNRIRRLYDIINVFKALGLISKVSNKLEKKIYVWQGEAGFSAQIGKLYTDCQDGLAGNKENQPSSEDVNLGKRVENSAFRLCQKFQDHELGRIKRVLSFQGQIQNSRHLI
jgi:hypothetical protein